MAAADSAATSISEYPSRSKPVVNVNRFGLCRFASAAIAVESMPPDRNEPTVTSARMCFSTESSSASAIWRYSFSGSSTGRTSKSGWKYRRGRSASPGRIRNHVPDSTRRTPACIDAGSGTYCSVR